MFGYVTPHLDQLEEFERQRYLSLYCGLCHALGDNQSQLARFGLTYDMAFLAMLLGSLYELDEETTQKRCAPHPFKARVCVNTLAVDYAAAMTVALIYHKCLDDWKDDRSFTQRAYAQALSKRYQEVRTRYPRQCETLEQALLDIDAIERASDAQKEMDRAATAFGRALAEIFAWRDDFWADELRFFGMKLGRLVYMMDALLDMDKDRVSGNYNPFVLHDSDAQDAFEDVVMLAHETAQAFEKFPLERDAHVLQSVVYAGVWHDYNAQQIEAKEQSGD